MVLDLLKARSSKRNLSLGYALAEFGEVDTAFLISEIARASPEEVDNVVKALGDKKQKHDSLAAVRKAAAACDSNADWRFKARLAIVALHLGDSDLAASVCELRTDPIQRSTFIDECKSWHGDLRQLADEMPEKIPDPLKSGLCCGIGSIPQDRLQSEVAKRTWTNIFTRWLEESDAGTHSAADWALRTWQAKLPEKEFKKLDNKRDWLDVVDADDGLTSLREAIIMANDRAGADEIVFDFGHDGAATIRLEHGELELTEAVTITGDAPGFLSIDAQQKSRIFNITAEDGDFAIEGVTLINGKTTGGNSGGAIRSLTHGSLTLHNSVVTDNSTAGSGGGVSAGGHVIVSESSILKNSAGFDGGGLYVFGDVTVISSTIEENTGSSSGSGQPDGGSNLPQRVSGGGGINAQSVNVRFSTISGNSEGYGGGIAARDVTLYLSTISGNSAVHICGEYSASNCGSGGGVSSSSVTVNSSTIAGNSAATGGGIRAGKVTIANSIVAGNRVNGTGADLSRPSLDTTPWR